MRLFSPSGSLSSSSGSSSSSYSYASTPSPLSPCTTLLVRGLLLVGLALQVSASYFVISSPASGTQWANGAPHAVQWQKAVLDGINGFDVEMARLGSDGLILVAMNVPATQGKLNLVLQDVPPADDYFLVFINSTHGVMHTASERFTVLPSGTSEASSTSAPAALPPAAGIPTVTVSGGPNPTAPFATTFPALPNGAVDWTVGRGLGAAFGVVLVGVVVGGWGVVV